MKKIRFIAFLLFMIISLNKASLWSETYEQHTYGHLAWRSGKNDQGGGGGGQEGDGEGGDQDSGETGEGDGGGDGDGEGTGGRQTGPKDSSGDNTGNLSDRTDAAGKKLTSLKNDSANSDSANGNNKDNKGIKNKASTAEGKKSESDKKSDKKVDANRDNSSDKKDSANSPTGGDPVRLSQGNYEQNETDFSVKLFEVTRKYDSSEKIVSSFGYGWSTNLDQRILLGTKSASSQMVGGVQEYITEMSQIISELENLIISGYSVSSIETADNEFNVRLQFILSTYYDAQCLYEEVQQLYYDSFGKGEHSRIWTLKNETDDFYAAISTKAKNYQSDYQSLLENLELLSDYKSRVAEAQGTLGVLKKEAELSTKRKQRNSKVMFPGMEEWYEETGIETITVIDEKGYPHLLYETAENSGVWKNENDNKLIECTKEDSGYKIKEKEGTEKLYDEAGFVICITDRNGNKVRLIRDEQENIKYVETSFGEKYSFEYSGRFIKKITNERSPEETAVYSYEGNYLTSVTDTEGDTVSMKYDSGGRMVSLNKCDGSKVKFIYGEQTSDGKNLATSTINEEGSCEYFEYDRSGKKTDYIDHDGNKTVYWYDEKHRTIREKRVDGTEIINDYDEDGNLVCVNENGNVTRYYYDSYGNNTETVYSDGSRETWTYDNYSLMTSWTDRDGVREDYIRDSKGNIREYKKGGKVIWTQEFDSKGQVTRKTVYGQSPVITDYEYDAYGNLKKEICSSVAREYEYDNRNRITKIRQSGKILSDFFYTDHKTVQKDYNGLETTYLVNGRKDITEIIKKDTITGALHKTRIEYDKRHLPIRIYTGDSETEKLIVSYTYTQEGKLKSEITHGKESWGKVYEYKNGQISAIKQFKTKSVPGTPEETELVENIYTQKYDYKIGNNNQKLLTVTDSLGIANLFEYDSYGNLIKTTNGNGEIIHKKYTKQGGTSAEQNPYGGWYEYDYKDGNIISAGEENGVAVRTDYYPDGSIKAQTDRYGKITYYNYDSRGRVSIIQNDTCKIWYEYDAFDRITKQVIGSTADINNCVYYVVYEYSEDGREVTITEGGKYRIENHLDAFGNVIKKTDGNNNERSFVYNEQNLMTESYDGNGNKTSYEYNVLGYISRVVLPDGAETEYSYNYMGLVENVTDNCGIVYAASYDKAGRLIKERSRADSEKSYEYDRAGRVIKVICGGEVVESYAYSSYGRTVTVKDGNGHDYLYNYDGFGHLIGERNRNNLEQKYFYDEDGQLQSQTDFSGSASSINYSSDRTVRTIRYSDGSENRFVYDAIGNIIEAHNQYGKTLYRYDQGGRMIYQKDITTGEEIYFEYDAAGNRKRLYSSNRDTTYSYGKNNEVKEIFDNKQRISIKLEYDKNGRELLRKFGNGTSEHTLYDRAGRITVKMQKDERGELLWGEGYSYASDGKRNATVDNSGRVTLYEYDSQGRLISVYYPCTDEMTATLKKEAEENGLPCIEEAGENKYLQSEIRNQMIPLMNAMQDCLAYNLTNLHTFIKESYSYDKNGNRISKTSPYGTIEYSYDKENCLMSSGSRGQTYINYTYDKMGNLLTEESFCKTIKYAYNAQNRLIYCEVTDKDVKEYAQTSYAYDAFGRRILVQDKGEAALRTLYDGLTFDVIKQSPTLANGMYTDSYENGIRWGNTGRPTGDRYRYLGDEDAKDNNRYFYLDENTWKTVNNRYRGERTSINVNGTIAAQTTADYGSEYFTTDLLGSVRTASDTYGAAKSKYTYDAFGTLVQGKLNGTTAYGYLGKPYDPTTKLYNYGYRDYNPQQSRFTTQDPIRDGNNWFAYCNGDPVNFVDLWGLFQNAVPAIYTMQGGDWKKDPLNGERDFTIGYAGCAIICAANMLNISPSQINKQYVYNGDIQWSDIARDYGYTVVKVDNSITKDIYLSQASNQNSSYTTFINVNWSDSNSSHWVGMNGIETINGKDYCVITASSIYDSNIENTTIKTAKDGSVFYDSHGNNRLGKGWKNENGQILVPVDQVKGYVTFEKKCNK